MEKDNKNASTPNKSFKKTLRKKYVKKDTLIKCSDDGLHLDKNNKVEEDHKESQDDSDCDSFGVLGDWGNPGTHYSKTTDSEESDDGSLKLQVSYG
jgi:hypothetical protein